MHDMQSSRQRTNGEKKMEIKRVAVLGSGVMGGAIAANVASAGIPVVLLDIVPKDAENRNQLTEGAVQRMLKAEPSPFIHPKFAELVRPGNLEDDLDQLKDVDWIVEAVLERIDIKHDVYKKIDAVRKKGSIVSSNTSNIPLNELVDGMSASFKQDFLITHFFNPPRYLRLFELVTGENTRRDAIEAIERFADIHLGKEIVPCHDTPGFIGNRIGCYWLQVGLMEALKRGLTVEEADALMGRPIGVPKTAVFGLYDLIGIDLMLLIGKALTGLLPKSDPYVQAYEEPELVKQMVAEGYTGRKGKGGFYRMNKEGGKKVMEVKNLNTGEYAPEAKPALESVGASKGGLKALFTHPDKGGEYAWAVMSQMMAYSASLVPEIADSIIYVDEAMRSGYGWKMGPFEMIDALGGEGQSGPAWFAEKLKSEGREVPKLVAQVGNGTFYRKEGGKRQYFTVAGTYADFPSDAGKIRIGDLKLSAKPVFETPGAKLWDLGDDVVSLEFTTKMGAIDNTVLDAIEQAIGLIPGKYKGLVIGSDNDPFCVGANLNFFLDHAKSGDVKPVEAIIARGQQVFLKLKQAPFPTVSALSGLALGGGCEVVLHSTAVQAHAESYAGLVEINVGLIPGWGGCKEMLIRHVNAKGAVEGAVAAFKAIVSARTSKSSEDAKQMLILNDKSGVSMNRLRLLADAKARVLKLANGYQPAAMQSVTLDGPAVKAALEAALTEMGEKASPHDQVIARKLMNVLTNHGKGGALDEQTLYDLEREVFMELVVHPDSMARIENMLNTGKPLKN